MELHDSYTQDREWSSQEDDELYRKEGVSADRDARNARMKGHAAKKAESVDIVKDYDWTAVPRGSKYRQEAPSAYVTAYELDYSQLNQMIDGYINLVEAEDISKTRKSHGGLMHAATSDPGMTFYRNIYKTANQLGNFNFPFFSDNIRGFTTEYTDSFSPISQRGAKFFGAPMIEGFAGMGESLIGGTVAAANAAGNMGGNAVADKIGAFANWGEEKINNVMNEFVGMDMPGLQTVGAPGSYIETPKFYQYSNTDAALDINFVLSNTIGPGTDGYHQNQKFITDFTKINRPKRLGSIGMTFPAIYHVEVPGLRYIEWAFLSNFSIGLMGTRRRIKNKILPEAFRCQFSFRSLTMEAANFMDQVDKVQAFSEGDANYIALRKKADRAAARTRQDEKDAAAIRAANGQGIAAGAGQIVPEDATMWEALKIDPNYVKDYDPSTSQ